MAIVDGDALRIARFDQRIGRSMPAIRPSNVSMAVG
jgi:hypothetical protein